MYKFSLTRIDVKMRVPMLLALGASVTLLVKSGELSTRPLSAFLDDRNAARGAVMTSIRIPLLTPASRFFSTKLAVRGANAHAVFNMSCLAVLAAGDEARIDAARVAVGYHPRADPDFEAAYPTALPWRNQLLTGAASLLEVRAPCATKPRQWASL